MTIYVENLTFDAIIGILPEERKVPQKVIVNVELDYEYKKGVFINYAILADLIENNIKQRQYELIEDALLALHVEIKSKFFQISSIKLKISKPTILAHADVSVESKMNY
jgi:dihydroneopterin aldolase